MSDKDRKLGEWEQKFAEAVRKYVTGEKLTPAEERMVAYGYTAATPGQKMGSELVNKVLVRRNK